MVTPGGMDARSAVVWRGLDEVLAGGTARDIARGGARDVIDAGGGTGTFAVPLALGGHRVTVVDPSPDALATLARRAAAAGVAEQIRGVQGDLDALPALVPDGADLVLCHNVLEVVDDVAAGLAAVAGVLRSGGAASILVAGRGGAVLGHVLAGRYADARAVVAGTDSGSRRFTADELRGLVAGAGLEPLAVRAVRVFSDFAAGSADADPEAAADLAALELAASDDPAYLGIAAQLHLLARKS